MCLSGFKKKELSNLQRKLCPIFCKVLKELVYFFNSFRDGNKNFELEVLRMEFLKTVATPNLGRYKCGIRA